MSCSVLKLKKMRSLKFQWTVLFLFVLAVADKDAETDASTNEASSGEYNYL